MLTWLQYHKEDNIISFMDNNNREIEGIVDTVHIEIDRHQKRIWYSVIYNEEIISVDGETFRKI